MRKSTGKGVCAECGREVPLSTRKMMPLTHYTLAGEKCRCKRLVSANPPQPADPRDQQIARLTKYVKRYRLYHDGVAECESAGRITLCNCSICSDVRAAIAAPKPEGEER